MVSGIVQPREIGIHITGRCNFDCYFCSTRGIHEKIDMQKNDFKSLIDKLAAAGIKCSILFGGGEPFLHPHAVEMIRYSVEKFGAKKVRVTTNLSKFPTDSAEAERLLLRLGGAGINISIDREHLRFDRKLGQKIKATITAAEKTGTKLQIFSVARNSSEEKNPFPREIARMIPERLKRSARVTLDSLSNAEAGRRNYNYWRQTAFGREADIPLGIMMSMGIYNLPFRETPKDTIVFLPNGKAAIAAWGELWFPQLSIGNWKREPIKEILGKNLAEKKEMIKGWLGFPKKEPAAPLGYEMPLAKKRTIFARTRLRALQKELAIRRKITR